MEALLVMLVLLATLWGLAYPAVLTALPLAEAASRILIAALFLFALFISPWLHRDSLGSRGLGSPAALVRMMRRCTLGKRLALGGFVIAAATVLTMELYRNATGTTRFVLGIEPAVTINLQRTLGGKAVLLALCGLLSLVWFTCIVRYDNWRTALRAAPGILALLLPITFLVAWAANGPAAFSQARPLNLVRNGLGYIFWGAIQQLIFCSYFGTRLRKGFAPANRPQHRAWKRLGVAVLNGLFFGVVHINSWLLVGFAWVLGICLAWAFMEERYRNLQALGLVHGVLGTCIIALFDKTGDAVTIRLRVGPWGMSHQWDLTTVAAIGMLVLGLLIALLLVVRHTPLHRLQ